MHAFHGGAGDQTASACRAYAAQLSEAGVAGTTSAPHMGDYESLTRARTAAREQKKLADHREGTQRALLERLLRSEKRYEWQQKQLQRVSTQLAQVRSRLAAVASERDAALDAARIAAEETESLREELARMHEELRERGGGGGFSASYAQQQPRTVREAGFVGRGGGGFVGPEGGFQAVAEAPQRGERRGGGTEHGLDGWPSDPSQASASELPPVSGLEATYQAAQASFEAISSAFVGAGGDPAAVEAVACAAGVLPASGSSGHLPVPDDGPAPLPSLNNGSVVPPPAAGSSSPSPSPSALKRRAPPPLPAAVGGGSGSPPPASPPDSTEGATAGSADAGGASQGSEGAPSVQLLAPPAGSSSAPSPPSPTLPAPAGGAGGAPPPATGPGPAPQALADPPPPPETPAPAPAEEAKPAAKAKKAGRCASFASEVVTDTKLIPMDEEMVRARESVPYNEDPSSEEDEETEDPPPPPPEGALGGIAAPPPPPASQVLPAASQGGAPSSFAMPDFSFGGASGGGAAAVPSATAPFGKKKKDLSNPFG